MAVAASKEMNAYFKQLQDEANRCYEVAREARAKGLDPELDVEIPQADDLASRVEMLLNLDGIANIIREASKKHPNREVMSIVVAKKLPMSTKDRNLKLLIRQFGLDWLCLQRGFLLPHWMVLPRSRFTMKVKVPMPLFHLQDLFGLLEELARQ